MSRKPDMHADWLFSSYTEDVSYWSVLGTLSALEALFATMRYINYLHLHLHLHWAAACLVWSPESCVTAARCSCARVVRWKVKVASSLTDVWQQLFEQQDINSMKVTWPKNWNFYNSRWRTAAINHLSDFSVILQKEAEQHAVRNHMTKTANF